MKILTKYQFILVAKAQACVIRKNHTFRSEKSGRFSCLSNMSLLLWPTFMSAAKLLSARETRQAFIFLLFFQHIKYMKEQNTKKYSERGDSFLLLGSVISTIQNPDSVILWALLEIRSQWENLRASVFFRMKNIAY